MVDALFCFRGHLRRKFSCVTLLLTKTFSKFFPSSHCSRLDVVGLKTCSNAFCSIDVCTVLLPLMVSFADMDTNSPHSSRPSSSAPVPGLQNCHSGSRDISLQEAGTNPPQSQSPIEDFDITVANLPEKLGFSSEFQEDLKSVGGNVHVLAERLLNSFNLEDSGSFRAGGLCSTAEQLEFYSETLNSGPMVTRWLKSGYEIPFTELPARPLSANNNKSCRDNLTFAREELKRQVDSGILSKVSYRPLVINPISCVYSNKWRLVVDCRLLNPYVAKRKIKLEDLRSVPAMVCKDSYMSTDNLEKGYWQV